MPESTALPSPDIEFFSRYDFPILTRDSGTGTGWATTSNTFLKGRPPRARGGSSVASLAQVGGGGVVRVVDMAVGGRPCGLATSTVTEMGDYYVLNDWAAAYGGGAGQAAGSLLPPPAVVMVADLHIAATGAAYAGSPADTVGIYFFPSAGALQPWGPPGVWAASPSAGGFGVFLNDDGGGANEFQYVSSDAVPNITQRTTLAVPDVTLWSTFRFILRTALPGAPANLTLQVNGSTVAGVNGIPFDDVTLFRPATLNANAYGFAFAQTMGGMGGQGMRFALSMKFGRFTPSGQELQGV